MSGMGLLDTLVKKHFKTHEEVLPPHLRGRLHNDWTGPFKRVPRSWNARGPRVGPDDPGYAPWPPRFVEGFGVAKWETANDKVEHHSVLFIPDLAKRYVKADEVYGREWMAIERNPGHPEFGKTRDVLLVWREAVVNDSPHPWEEGNYRQNIVPNDHSPSALQEFSDRGWMRLDPKYYSRWWVLKRDADGSPKDGRSPNMRHGFRPDHEDEYYNKSFLYVGGNFE